LAKSTNSRSYFTGWEDAPLENVKKSEKGLSPAAVVTRTGYTDRTPE
jgi:hypothetical protein